MNMRTTIPAVALAATTGLLLSGLSTTGSAVAEDRPAPEKPAKPAPRAVKRTVLVELFTSQG